MTRSFLISYPDIPVTALTVASTQTYDSYYPIYSSFNGPRHNWAQLASNATSLIVTYDTGAGNTRQVDHFIVGDAWLLTQAGVTGLWLAGSNDGSSWGNMLGTTTNFQTRVLHGPHTKDMIFVNGSVSPNPATVNDELGPNTSAYRYFRVEFAGASSKFPVSKFYFGQFFDMGRETDNFEWEGFDGDLGSLVYPRGHMIMSKSTHTRLRLTIEWDAVTDDKATEFQTKILKDPIRNTLFLFTGTTHSPLADTRLLFCKVVDANCQVSSRKRDWHTVTAVFEQIP